MEQEKADRPGILPFPQNRKTQWLENPKLYSISCQLGRENLVQKLLDAHVTDLWLPIPKRILQKILEEDGTKCFLDAQERYLDDEIPMDLKGQHLSLTDSDYMGLKEMRMLGAGGYGEVHHAVDPRTGMSYARKVMSRPMNFEKHRYLMNSFRRELSGMRRVRHRHCVDLIATCTDTDSVMLLSSPVADMDLATFLDLDLSGFQHDMLRRAVGCITSALAYLHKLDIRHDDLKPNNILIHGPNILLTDFGFCLDFSDSAISTTTGPPTHRSQRYSAPEVFDHEPRNRLTDIWGLGCVLFEILSRLYGCKLSEMKEFWHSNGTRYDSFAENPAATTAWLAKLTKNQAKTQSTYHRARLWLTSFVYHVLLRPERLLRPTAKQVLHRLEDLDAVYPVGSWQSWVAACCATQLDSSTSSIAFRRHIPQWPILDLMMADDHLAYLFLDMDLEIFASSKNLSFLDHVAGSGAQKLGRLFAAGPQIEQIRREAHLILEIAGLQSRITADPNTILAQTMNSIFTCRLQDTTFWVNFFDVYLENDEIPHVRTVQTSLQTICLERQPGYRTSFIVMTFDPNEGEVAKAFDRKQRKVADFSYKGSRDVWTDGLSISATLFTGEKMQQYAYLAAQVSKRQKEFDVLLNEWRTLKKDFAEAKCFRCTLLSLPCRGPEAGGCGQCKATSSICRFKTAEYIDDKEYIDELVTTRWAS